VQTSGFGLCIIYTNYLSCFKVLPEPGQRNWTISCHRIRPKKKWIIKSISGVSDVVHALLTTAKCVFSRLVKYASISSRGRRFF
jgi:hypothetical protein